MTRQQLPLPTYGEFEPTPDFRVEERREWVEDGPGTLLGWDIVHSEWSVDYFGETCGGVVAFIEDDDGEDARRFIVDALNAYAVAVMDR